MPAPRLPLILLCLLAPAGPAVGAGEPPEPPALNQPPEFSHLMGAQFTIQVKASTTNVFVEDPITLIVTISGRGPFPNMDYLPQRKYLKVIPDEMLKDFYVAALPDKDRHDPQTNTWEFHFQVRPKSEKVEAIPVLTLSYYNPQANPGYQRAFTDEIPLKVKPAPPPPVVAPKGMYDLATGTSVLRRADEVGPNWLLVGLGLVLPPIGSFVGYRMWRWYHPDHVGLARRRRSRAAQETLRALRRLANDPYGRASAAVITQYLHARLGLTPADPTPLEAARHLWRAGLSPELTERVVRFYRAGDARFAPVAGAPPRDRKKEAAGLILAVEEEAR